jgi:AraC family transcriptional regulator of adaptative response/methylated-DNA-[protein]-cysteine methyltransferase
MAQTNNILTQATISTPLGAMIAIADHESLYFLAFTDNPDLEKRISSLLQKTNAQLINGTTPALESIQKELTAYFSDNLKTFKTPVRFIGSTFQQKSWQQLAQVPYGTTQSYGALASSIEKPSAYRAVAQANGANNLVIIIPCHRIINANGALGGYNAGLERKKWLLAHESSKK